MKLRRSLASRLQGVTWDPDLLRRVHVQFAERALVFDPHFEEVRQAWLERKLELPAACDLALAAMAAEMVIDADQLPAFLASLKDAFLSRGRPWTIWPTGDGRIDARRLSDHTVVLIGKLNGIWPSDWNLVLTELSDCLAAHFPRLRLRAKFSRLTTLQALLRGAAAHTTSLPGVFQHHLLGLQTLTPLDRSTLARIEGQRALAPTESNAVNDDEHAAAVAEAIEAVAVGIGGGESDVAIDFTLLNEAQAALAQKVRGGYGKQRRHALDAILRRLERPQSTETAIVLAFPAHLLTVGTLQRKRASMRNVRSYSKSLVAALRADRQVLRALLSDEPTEAYDGYQRLLASTAARSKEQRKELRKATGAFRAYLMHRFDTPYVPLGPKPQDWEAAVPAAQYIDEATVERLIERINASSANERVLAMAVCMLQLALDVPLRISDLWRLRRADVVPHGETIVVDFKAHRNEDRPKTGCSVGAVGVKADAARQSMLAWCQRRQKESVSTAEPFFGDGYAKPTLHQAMEAYKLLNRLIKEVTGDRQASFHSLRHTSISNQVDCALTHPSASMEIDPLHEVSARSRHASTTTPLRTYSHLYVEGLRKAVDGLLLRLTNHRIVARWTGLNESTLSKRARGRDPQEVWAEALRFSASRVHIPGADQGAVFAPPIATVAPTPKVLFTDVLHILEFLARGESIEQVSERSGLSVALCNEIDRERRYLSARGLQAVEELHWGTPKLAGLVQFACGSPDNDLMRRAAEACIHLAVGDYLDASNASRIDPIWRLLRHVQYSPALLLLRSDDDSNLALQESLHLFSLRFGAHPAVEGVQQERSARPSVYLMLMSQTPAKGKTAGPRNACTKGFVDLMCAAFVYQTCRRFANGSHEVS